MFGRDEKVSGSRLTAVQYIILVIFLVLAYGLWRLQVVQSEFYAALAEKERKLGGERTKAALAQAKLRGVKLGNPRLHEARAAYLDATRQARETRDAAVLDIAANRASWRTLTDLSEKCFQRGIVSRTGQRLATSVVWRVLARGVVERNVDR